MACWNSSHHTSFPCWESSRMRWIYLATSAPSNLRVPLLGRCLNAYHRLCSEEAPSSSGSHYSYHTSDPCSSYSRPFKLPQISFEVAFDFVRSGSWTSNRHYNPERSVAFLPVPRTKTCLWRRTHSLSTSPLKTTLRWAPTSQGTGCHCLNWSSVSFLLIPSSFSSPSYLDTWRQVSLWLDHSGPVQCRS